LRQGYLQPAGVIVLPGGHAGFAAGFAGGGGGGLTDRISSASVFSAQQARQLGEVYRHALGLVAAQQIGRRSVRGFMLK
jgi:hypothetical protein